MGAFTHAHIWVLFKGRCCFVRDGTAPQEGAKVKYEQTAAIKQSGKR